MFGVDQVLERRRPELTQCVRQGFGEDDKPPVAINQEDRDREMGGSAGREIGLVKTIWGAGGEVGL